MKIKQLLSIGYLGNGGTWPYTIWAILAIIWNASLFGKS